MLKINSIDFVIPWNYTDRNVNMTVSWNSSVSDLRKDVDGCHTETNYFRIINVHVYQKL